MLAGAPPCPSSRRYDRYLETQQSFFFFSVKADETRALPHFTETEPKRKSSSRPVSRSVLPMHRRLASVTKRQKEHRKHKDLHVGFPRVDREGRSARQSAVLDSLHFRFYYVEEEVVVRKTRTILSVLFPKMGSAAGMAFLGLCLPLGPRSLDLLCVSIGQTLRGACWGVTHGPCTYNVKRKGVNHIEGRTFPCQVAAELSLGGLC